MAQQRAAHPALVLSERGHDGHERRPARHAHRSSATAPSLMLAASIERRHADTVVAVLA